MMTIALMFPFSNLFHKICPLEFFMVGFMIDDALELLCKEVEHKINVLGLYNLEKLMAWRKVDGGYKILVNSQEWPRTTIQVWCVRRVLTNDFYIGYNK